MRHSEYRQMVERTRADVDEIIARGEALKAQRRVEAARVAGHAAAGSMRPAEVADLIVELDDPARTAYAP